MRASLASPISPAMVDSAANAANTINNFFLLIFILLSFATGRPALGKKRYDVCTFRVVII